LHKEGDDMPSKWSERDERKYQHIKQSARQRGASAERAKEIAARTVNRDRRTEGRTPNRTTQGTGNPNRPLEERTRRELYNLAKEHDVEGRSRMSKRELIRALR
jgi:plasmid stabilization system protein ParE